MPFGVLTTMQRMMLALHVRRALSLFFVVAFLFASVGHASQHASECLANPIVVSSVADNSSDSPEPAAKEPVIDACGPCHMFAMPVAVASLGVRPALSAMAVARTPATHAHPPAADFRPPIA